MPKGRTAILISTEEAWDIPGSHMNLPRFLRPPYLPYIHPKNGSLVFESIQPPMCRDGCAMFYQQQISLSKNGKTLEIRQYRAQAPLPDRLSGYFYIIKSTIPYRFDVAHGNIVNFEVKKGEIISCTLTSPTGNKMLLYPHPYIL